LVNPEKELASPADVLAGAQHILAEQIADTAEARHAVRCVLWQTGKLTARKRDNLPDGQGLDYKDYSSSPSRPATFPASHPRPQRGEKEGPNPSQAGMGCPRRPPSGAQ